ncbi:MAG: malto-oligosyltrehalose trehalohydrolase [Aquabacterium sp.]|nr:MAG: malto-oligosyltrehalose trehalohydrolase [Aquabacterium sp.]
MSAATKARPAAQKAWHCVHRMPFGATRGPGGEVSFHLWAPAAKQVELLLAPPGEPPQALDRRLKATADEHGRYSITVAGVDPGTWYRWRVDGELDVPDPASRFNPLGPHGPSQVIDPSGFDWGAAERQWRGRPWEQAVVYELHVGSFTPQGTYAAAQDKLQHLADTGITAVQLMPLAAFPGRFGWGYDGVLPYAPHAAYGTPDDLRRFVRRAHELGLMVLLDVVYNHFGPDGNYLHRYAPSFFTDKHHTAWGAAVNFDAPGSETVREFFIHNALYWLEEFRFDGLRFDAVHAIVDDSPIHLMAQLSQRVRQGTSGRHVHLVLENDSNDATLLALPGTPGRYDGQWNGDFHHTLHVHLTGEADGYYAEYVGDTLQQLGRVLTRGFAWQGPPHLVSKGEARKTAQSAVPLGATVNFLHNHDQVGNRAFGERWTVLAGEPALRLATAMLLLGPATPMLFMGEEWGARTPFFYFADWSGDLARAVTEGRRREFAAFPAFADAAARARIPDPCDERTFSGSKLDWAELAAAEGRKWLDYHRMLLALRREAIEPRLPGLLQVADGSAHRLDRIDGNGLRVRWAFKGPRILEMAVNLGNEPVTIAGHAEVPPAAVQAQVFQCGEVRHDGLFGPWAGSWRWISQVAGEAR